MTLTNRVKIAMRMTADTAAMKDWESVTSTTAKYVK